MRIVVASDLHLEFPQHQQKVLNYKWPDADLLVLAGDVFNAPRLRPDRTDKDARRHWHASDELVNRLTKQYSKIVYVMGNHDHYNGRFSHSEATLRQFFGDRIELLQNQTTNHMGLEIVGTTLWTDFCAADPQAMSEAMWGMNDYRVILHDDGYPIKAADTLDEHRIARGFIDQAVRHGTHKRLVVTHHAPSMISLHKKHKGGLLDYAYASDLEALAGHGNIVAWIHGHTHQNEDYILPGNTRVFANQQGYYSENFNNFDPANGVMEIDVPTSQS